MDLRVFTEPQQGATYDDLLRVARATETLGFDAFFRSDHYKRIGPGDPGPGSTDAWVTLGALARETSRIRLGTLLSPVTFRQPGPLAISVAQVDAMSGGRVELGLGTGWFGEEHVAYGIPFLTTGERFDRLDEQLTILTGLWTTEPGQTFSHHGAHYTLEASPGLPKPVQQPRPPIIVGGHGVRPTRPGNPRASPGPPGGRARRSSSAATGRAERRLWPLASPTSSTFRSRTPLRRRPSSSIASGRPAATSVATPRTSGCRRH